MYSTDHDVVLRGMRFHYLDWGTAGRPPVLFLHGGALTAHTWDPVCLALRDRFHCLALDQRGHGDSEWAPMLDYAGDDHVGDIEALVERLELERFALVGQSLGGSNALRYAIRHGHRVSALALIDVGPEPRHEGTSRVVEFVQAAAEPASLDELVDRARSFNPRRDADLLRTTLLHNLRRLRDGRFAWKYDRRHLGPGYLERVIAELAESRELAHEVECPTLVVRGAESDVMGDEDAAEFAARFQQGAWVRIDGAGHTVQGDNPRGLARALAEFLV